MMKRLYALKGVHIANSLLLAIGFGLLFVAVPASGLVYAKHVEHSYNLQLQTTQSVQPIVNSQSSSQLTSPKVSVTSTSNSTSTVINVNSSQATVTSNSSTSTQIPAKAPSLLKTVVTPSVVKSSSTSISNTDSCLLSPSVTAQNHTSSDSSPTNNRTPLISLPIGISIDSSQIVVEC